MTWIATLNALDGAAAVGLGYIDYKTVYGNDKDLIYAMRKKRLAFAKLSFIMATSAIFLIDKPSSSAIIPLIIGQAYTSGKILT